MCSLPNAAQCGRSPHLKRTVKGSTGLIHLLVQQPELHFVGPVLLLVLLLVPLQAKCQLEGQPWGRSNLHSPPQPLPAAVSKKVLFQQWPRASSGPGQASAAYKPSCTPRLVP